MADEKEKDEQLPGQMNLFDNEQPETDDQVTGEDDETCEEEACEPDENAGGKKSTRRKKADGKKETAPKATPASKPASAPGISFTYPFNLRYAAGFLDLTGFVDGKAYSAAEIKQVLIQNGFDEFQEVDPEFHRSDATNTLVITIKGSRKGCRRD